jgi:hypothetical protein
MHVGWDLRRRRFSLWQRVTLSYFLFVFRAQSEKRKQNT